MLVEVGQGSPSATSETLGASVHGASSYYAYASQHPQQPEQLQQQQQHTFIPSPARVHQPESQPAQPGAQAYHPQHHPQYWQHPTAHAPSLQRGGGPSSWHHPQLPYTGYGSTNAEYGYSSYSMFAYGLPPQHPAHPLHYAAPAPASQGVHPWQQQHHPGWQPQPVPAPSPPPPAPHHHADTQPQEHVVAQQHMADVPGPEHAVRGGAFHAAASGPAAALAPAAHVPPPPNPGAPHKQPSGSYALLLQQCEQECQAQQQQPLQPQPEEAVHGGAFAGLGPKAEHAVHGGSLQGALGSGSSSSLASQAQSHYHYHHASASYASLLQQQQDLSHAQQRAAITAAASRSQGCSPCTTPPPLQPPGSGSGAEPGQQLLQAAVAAAGAGAASSHHRHHHFGDTHHGGCAQHAWRAGQPVVVVWDLDETLIVFNALLNGSFAKAMPGTCAASAQALGKQLGDAIFAFCDAHLGFEAVEHVDPIQIEELQALLEAHPPSPQDGSGAAGRHAASAPAAVAAAGAAAGAFSAAAAAARVRSVYECGGVARLLGPAQAGELAATMSSLDALTGGWLTAARGLVQGITAAATEGAASAAVAGGGGAPAPPVRHVLVSAGQLVGTLGKLLMFGLDGFFPLDSVFSASRATKMDCFKRIAARYGRGAAYVAVGDGAEEMRAASVMGWGFVRVALADAAAAATAEAAGGGGGGGGGSRLSSNSACAPIGARPHSISAQQVLAAAVCWSEN